MSNTVHKLTTNRCTTVHRSSVPKDKFVLRSCVLFIAICILSIGNKYKIQVFLEKKTFYECVVLVLVHIILQSD